MEAQAETIWWAEDLRLRYRKSRLTIWRWVTEGHLPKPDVHLADKDGWYPSTIIEHERRSAQSSASP